MNWRKPSVILLTWVNLLPLVGVFLWDWNIVTILMLYWLESVFIGALNVPKILMCQGSPSSKIFTSAFFTVHYGGFAAGHLMALGFLLHLDKPLEYFQIVGPMFWLAAISLFLSHLYSFFANFLGQQEYTERSESEQMFKPYRRVFILHFIILFGGVFIMSLPHLEYLIVLLVLLKIALDVRAHLKDHMS